MISLYRLLRERCGLSLREAAEFHEAALDTVTSWSSGRNNAPQRAMDDLRALYERIEAAADQLIEIAPDDGSGIEIGLASDDAEAQSLGWPCVGAHAAAIALAAIHIDNPVTVVPRGSTPATAAAADVHDKKRDRKR